MRYRLVMFTGSTSGAGKSTLSDFLYRQLIRHGISARWTYEEDFVRMDLLAEYNRLWAAGDPCMADALLAAARALFAGGAWPEDIWIVDTLFPGFFWLLGRVPMERIERYGQELAEVLLPLEPLVVYLDTDVPTAYTRATAARGSVWAETIDRFIMNWKLPHYPEAPLCDHNDLLRFKTWVNDQARRILALWSGEVLTLDTMRLSLPRAQDALLHHFGLDMIPDETVPPETLLPFTGTYEPCADNRDAEPLVVRLEDGFLAINRFWPAGCRLIPEGGRRFRLQAASREIIFDVDADGQVLGLTYVLPNARHWYRRVGRLQAVE
jgi:hypothetical protein